MDCTIVSVSVALCGIIRFLCSRSSGVDSPPFLRHQKTAGVDGSIKKYVETQNKSPVLNRQTSDVPQSYLRTKNDGEISNSHKSRKKLIIEEEDNRSRSSTNSSLTSEDEERKPNSFLYQKSAAFENDPGKLSVAQQASIFASMVVAESNSQLNITKNESKTPDSYSDGEKRVSSLKTLIDQNSFGSSSQNNVHESRNLFEPKQPKRDSLQKSPPQIPSPKLPSSWLHSKAIDSESPHSSPEPPRKPSPAAHPPPRVPSNKYPTRVPSKPKRPTAPPPKRPPPLVKSTSSGSTLLSEVPSSTGAGAFNPLDEYNKIEKQVSEEDDQTNKQNIEAIKQKLNSRTNSTASTTSGDFGVMSSSIEQPVKEVIEDDWSDSSDEGPPIPPYSENTPEESAPTVSRCIVKL